MKAWVALDWYELPETRELFDEAWRALAPALVAAGVEGVPPRLSRPDDPHQAARAGGALLTQLCGYFIAGAGRGLAVPVATPRYAAPGCRGATYCSFIAVPAHLGVGRFEALAGARAVISDPCSHTGYNALRRRVAAAGASMDDGFFASVATSGSHLASVAALRRGEADVAAIDCITWAMIARHRPGDLDALAVLEETPPAPAPPLVTAPAHGPQLAALRRGLAAFMADPAAADARDALLWGGLEILELEAYAPLATKP